MLEPRKVTGETAVVRSGDDDILLTTVKIETVHEWPWVKVATVSHRRDLADLDEPYLSAVRAALVDES